MWKLLGLDFEAQDENPLTTRPTELGAILVSIEGDTAMKKLEELSTLFYTPDYPPQSELVVELTGITDDQLKAEGVDPVSYFRDKLFPLMEKADFILAHNKKYDERLFKAFCAKHGLTPPEKVWICTYVDVPYPAKYTCKKLAHLALDHGILMDHRKLHRATADVELMLELVMKYSFGVILKYAQTPWIFVRAWCKPPWEDGGISTALAKKQGYSWQTARGTDEPVFDKQWVKRIKADQLQKEKDALDLHVAEVQGKI